MMSNKTKLILSAILHLVIGIFFLLQVADSTVDYVYAGRILPGLSVAGVRLGNLTEEGAWALLAPRVTSLSHSSLILHRDRFTLNRSVSDLGFSSGRQVALGEALNFGREGLLPIRVKDKSLALFGTITLPVGWEVDQATFDGLVDIYLSPRLEKEARDAQVVVERQRVELKPAVVGATIDRESLVARIKDQLGRLSLDPVLVPVTERKPSISNEEALQAQNIITGTLVKPLTLKAGFDSFGLSEEELWGMIRVSSSDGELTAELDEGQLRSYLRDLEGKVNQNLQEAKLTIQGSRAVEFVPPQDYVRLLINESLEKIQEVALSDEKTVELAREVKHPTVNLASTNNLGINELVARGTSNFKGSPPNRRHNIQVGISKFDGLIIAPGENFSFIGALGRVDASSGYRPELVIKGDETIPEYGGGLCQVSTTAFRAILNGGYPVLERQNHSYRVIYYEPAGSDATIYPPHPDLRFTNDTPGSILIHGYTKGDDAFFDFYGTSLSRKVVLDGPHILKTTPYPAPVYIETSTLAPGVVKQVDRAHRGADTVLYRYVYDESGALLCKDTFKSHYISWPSKFLVGRAEAPRVETDLKQAPPAQESEEEPLKPLT